MSEGNLKLKEISFALIAAFLVLFVHGAIPFLMLPTLGQAVWTTGFSESIANGSLFEFYARDFGIPKPAAIAFGLAGAWPASLLIRLGLQAADAYAAMVALWLALAMFSAYCLARRFGGTRLIALFGALIWMTMPISWAHSGYSMLSLGIALLSFYFLAAVRLFLIEARKLKIDMSSMVLYVIAAVVSVFMDGYTFMMYAVGSSILLIYTFLVKDEVRSTLLKIAVPVHVISFALAYTLYSLYIGKSNFDSQPIDFFRGWGLDLSFLVVPSKGVLWLPDLFDISVKRTDELYFGDSSVWVTTFALPALILGFISWLCVRNKTKISTGILIISLFGFYMALGPSLKINSTKPESLQISHPRQQSSLMPYDYGIARTGNEWISEKLPGFNVMRASYRWSALGIFALWLLIIIWISRVDREKRIIWIGLLIVLFLLNMPDFGKRWRSGIDNRSMFRQIDQELVAELDKKIRSNETVAFLPWGNDFLANYLAPRVGFRTFNIGGDKNLSAAQAQWPQTMLLLGGELNKGKAISLLKLLIYGIADVIVLPYFHMLWSAHLWPCVDKTIARLTDDDLDHHRKIPGFICPSETKVQLQPVISVFRALPYVEISENDFFATVRLRSEFADQKSRLALISSIIGNVKYPVSIDPEFAEASYVLQDGWHGMEAHHVWSKSEARLLLPVPKHCQAETCELRLIFGVFGASAERPVEIFFNSAEPDWDWSKKVTAISSEPISLNVPLSGAAELRNFSISVPDAKSPLDLIGSPDGRILGISLQRIELVRP